MSDTTYWNGEETPARKVRVKVGRPLLPTWWCAKHEGTTREAVEITYGGHKFYLDNEEDGSGWKKVTEGRGSPNQYSRSLPDDSVVIDAL
jgi:hypothetical protein